MSLINRAADHYAVSPNLYKLGGSVFNGTPLDDRRCDPPGAGSSITHSLSKHMGPWSKTQAVAAFYCTKVLRQVRRSRAIPRRRTRVDGRSFGMDGGEG